MAGDYIAGVRRVRRDVLVLLVLLWQPRGWPHSPAGEPPARSTLCLLALALYVTCLHVCIYVMASLSLSLAL